MEIPVQVTFRDMPTSEAVREAVARGLGIGFLFAREGGRDPACRALPIQGYEACNQDMLLCLKDQRNVPLVARFRRLAQSLPR